MSRFLSRLPLAAGLFALSLGAVTVAQEKSVKPGINDSFKNPDVAKYAKTFEGESREVSAKRKEIADVCKLKPGMAVADVGAGTGLFTRQFAPIVGGKGKVYAVDISEKFLDHIKKTCRDAKITNVETVKCSATSTELPANSVDLVFVCDTYHHFEYPYRTLASIHKALKPGGRLVLIDFHRIKGKSSDFIMGHVRAGQEVFVKEVEESGFKKVHEEKELLKENYLVVFEKVEAAKGKGANQPAKLFPVIEGYGGVVAVGTEEGPRKGSKVVFDVTGDAKESGKPVPGLERAALLYNLAGREGLKPADLNVAIVLHGSCDEVCSGRQAVSGRIRLGEPERRTPPPAGEGRGRGVRVRTVARPQRLRPGRRRRRCQGRRVRPDSGDQQASRRLRLHPRPVTGAAMIRPAMPDDIPTIARLIRGLAEYERLADKAVFRESDLRDHLFGERRYAEVLLAEDGGTVVGFALFFHNYSTFRGKPGIYLEDLFVFPEARGKGHGKALLRAIAKLAVERDCARVEWSVLDWNTPSIEFYKSLGAEPLDAWTAYRLTDAALAKLAAGT